MVRAMIWTIPNILTVFRLLAAPAVPILFAAGGFAEGADAWRWAAFGLFAAASITDFFDGWLARRLNQQSAVGKMLDPIADKAATILALAVLATAGGLGSLIPAVAIIFREVLISGVREFIGQSAALSVTRLAKWKTTVQMTAITLLLLPAVGGFGAQIHMAGLGLLWVAAVLTLITGWDYLCKALAHLEKTP